MMRIRWRLPLAFALTTLIFAGLVALVAAVGLRGVLLDRLQDDMVQQARQFAALLDFSAREGSPGAGLQDGTALQELTVETGRASTIRVTVIDHEGVVLADSAADPASLDNHVNRPEVAQALATGEGRARRKSATLGVDEVYVAVRLSAGTAPWSGGVVRAAQPASRVDDLVAAAWRVPLYVWLIVLLPTLVAGHLLTRPLIRPLERLQQMTARVASGDFSVRTGISTHDELGELAHSLNEMAEQLESRNRDLGAESERLEQMLAAMDEGVLLIDEEGRLVRANPAAERILGVRLRGQEKRPLVVAARSFPALALAQKARLAGQALTESIQLPDARWLGVEVVPLSGVRSQRQAGVPTRDATGHTLFVIRDESERRATEQMRRDFVTNVSHELKTPLAGLSLLAETLRHAIEEDPEQAQKFAERLSQEVARLNQLTEDLLALSRLEEAEAAATMVRVRVDLDTLAGAVLEELRPAAEAKDHEVTLTSEGAGRVAVSGDEVSLQTLLRNLLDNAIRYTEPGGHIQVGVRTEVGADGRTWAVLEVSDDGVGIPLADQKRIFERFYRVDKARSRQTGGTGLGLSIVKHVAELHGGSVEVKSTLGVGSTFTVRLPAVEG